MAVFNNVCITVRGIVLRGERVDRETHEKVKIHIANCKDCKRWDNERIRNQHKEESRY